MSGNVFLAVGLSDDERHAIAQSLTDRDLARRIPGRRVPPDNWHITLQFVGEASEADTDRLAERVEAHLDIGRGRASVGGVGAFPRPARATVLYLEVHDQTERLGALAALCAAAAEEVGFAGEERRFVPHLTLSRVRPAQSVVGLIDEPSLDIPLNVDRVVMYRTIARRGGVQYRPLHEFPLIEGDSYRSS